MRDIVTILVRIRGALGQQVRLSKYWIVAICPENVSIFWTQSSSVGGQTGEFHVKF